MDAPRTMNPATNTTIANDARRRFAALAAMAATLVLGLASRHWPAALPGAWGKYPGDALWALMVFFGWRALRAGARTRDVALLAMATSVAVECAKLWQAPWLVEFRYTTIGHLLLGHVFSRQNLVAYAFGVVVGVALDHLLLEHAAPRRRPAHAQVARQPPEH
jgi:hypothetical protein